ncbi:competence/damage-inducible protein A [Clostridium aminobutyricum]|uniref:Putative competence-damage inducible protein n=1 Tax=Clostridium aminobutyricum TaxID=33953 RepID=A0A939IGU7_CLOAM|nr:competence/damage-inducible protein A [Clostridium aminobutyricum]MBN7772557.1 competence/damage-inducible protein A [Clostridium aminobutyricum]
MKAAILSVGTELLFGEITNTNSVYLSQQLNLLGCDVLYHYSVGDNPIRLKETIQTAFKDCDLIITSGGLGPTQDDLTKEVACETLHDELVLNESTMKALEDAFKRMKKTMTENNKKQAYVPSRAIVFDNDAGSAPGFALEENGNTIICLPGPPREMTRLFERKVKPYLESKIDGKIYHRMIRTIGIGESQLETELLDLIDNQTDPTLATYAKEGECCLRIASKRETLEEAEQAVNDMLDLIKERIGEYIYSSDDEDLVEVVAKLLMENNISISCAESCTGGLFAQTLIDIPGISAVFDRGFVTYSNQAKIEELGVKEETLEQYGAVSSQTAMEMAQGVQKASGSRLCISVTGIAGPDGGSEEKPVGLSYVGVIFDDKQVCEEIQTRNVNRKWNRNTTALYMLNIVRKIILDPDYQ